MDWGKSQKHFKVLYAIIIGDFFAVPFFIFQILHSEYTLLL